MKPNVLSKLPQLSIQLQEIFWCCNNALTKMRERDTVRGKKQSKSSTTNMPLNLLMISTSPYSGSLQLAIKFLTDVDSWGSCFSAGQVLRSCIRTSSICYFQWCLTHTEGIVMFCASIFPSLFASFYNNTTGSLSKQFPACEPDMRYINYSVRQAVLKI